MRGTTAAFRITRTNFSRCGPATMPLQHMGYVTEYLDVNHPLPENDLAGGGNWLLYLGA
jgi:hypothetical protein